MPEKDSYNALVVYGATPYWGKGCRRIPFIASRRNVTGTLSPPVKLAQKKQGIELSIISATLHLY